LEETAIFILGVVCRRLLFLLFLAAVTVRAVMAGTTLVVVVVVSFFVQRWPHRPESRPPEALFH
jgi:hypothetical protein